MTTLDQTRDPNGQHLYGLLNTVGPDGVKLFDPPDFVKSSSADCITGDDKITPNAYGDPRDRLFPCHTAPATWVSALFFHTQKQAMSRKISEAIEKRIDAAAAHHGIAGTIEQIKTAVVKTAVRTEEQLPDDTFAMLINWPDGTTERHLPMRNPTEVKKACEFIIKNGREYTFSDRRVVSERVLKKAVNLKVDLGADFDALQKQAGHGTCAPETAAAFVFERAKAVRLLGKDLDMAENLAKLAEQCLQQPDFVTVPSNLHKIAEFVERVDAEHDLRNLSTLSSPDTLFSINGKIASEVMNEHVAMTSGHWYSKEALAGLSLVDVRSVMGDRFADEIAEGGLFVNVEKLAEIAPTLPRGDAELFDQLMGQLKIQPVYKEARHAPSGPLSNRNVLFELADAHAGR